MSLLEKATLITTPTAHSNGTLHSIKGGAVADFDVVRGSAATRVNAEGPIESVAANIPRIDYTTGEGVILTEPQSTNLVTYSEDFSQWSTAGDVTIESGYLAPDGTNNAYKISGTDNSIKTTLVSLLGTSQRTIFARTVSGTGTAKLLTHRNNTNNLFTITEQWQRFEVNSITDTSAETTFFGVDFRGGSLTEIILWGANATNDQDYATSYIPTSGAIATRLADSISGAGDATTFNSTEGVLYAEMSGIGTEGASQTIGMFSNNVSSRVLFRRSQSTNRVQALVYSSNIIQFNVNAAMLDGFNKVALKYKENDFALWVNGVEVGTSNSGLVPADLLSKLSFKDEAVDNPFYGKTKALAVWKEALTDEELTCLTTI